MVKMTNIIACVLQRAATLSPPLLGQDFQKPVPMNSLRTDIKTWFRNQEQVSRGRMFPFGDFSCVPLASDQPDTEDSPVGFLLSKGSEITLVTPQENGGNADLWDHLVAEMAQWHALPTRGEVLPPECWYG